MVEAAIKPLGVEGMYILTAAGPAHLTTDYHRRNWSRGDASPEHTNTTARTVDRPK